MKIPLIHIIPTQQFLAVMMATILSCLTWALTFLNKVDAADPVNILIITVDDMSADSVGCFGAQLKDTTPTIDALALSGLRFENAHVCVGNCMPSRNVMWSGRYPHSNGIEGFYQNKNPDYPVLCDLMKGHGYFAAIRGKVSHSTPYHPYAWDLDLDTGPDGKEAHFKDPASYGISTTQGITAAKAAEKPFCLMINISDPHKPFYGETKGGKGNDQFVPSKLFTAAEIPIPAFLFDDPVVRDELVLYYDSVRRADDAVKSVLAALDASGKAEQTIVFFLSDHGMPLPFAKTQVYHHSTHTPLIIRWPGVTKANTIDQQHMISGIDILPTLLDMAGAKHPPGLQGRSFVDVIKGGKQEKRDFIFKEYNENSGSSRDPMRAIQNKQYLYVFNPWSNGERVMATATSGTKTYKRMVELAKNNPELAKRLDLYQHRVPEELFNIENDPDCLHNLIKDKNYQKELDGLRAELEQWMVDTNDHMLDTFRKRDNPAAREKYVLDKEAESAARKGKGGGKKKPSAEE